MSVLTECAAVCFAIPRRNTIPFLTSFHRIHTMKTVCVLFALIAVSLASESLWSLFVSSRIPTHLCTLEEVFVNAENYYDAGYQVEMWKAVSRSMERRLPVSFRNVIVSIRSFRIPSFRGPLPRTVRRRSLAWWRFTFAFLVYFTPEPRVP